MLQYYCQKGKFPKTQEKRIEKGKAEGKVSKDFLLQGFTGTRIFSILTKEGKKEETWKVKKSWKITAVMLMMILSVAVLSACGSTQLARPSMAEGATAVDVSGTCEATLDGDVLKVTAKTTNLDDGVIGRISVASYDGRVLEKKVITKSGDNLSAEFTVGSDWPETVYCFYVADPSEDGRQLDAVYEKYGKKFENMQGDQVIISANGLALTLRSEKIEIPQ